MQRSQSTPGKNLTLTVPAGNITLAGASAGNYTPPTTNPTTTANINALPVTVSLVAANKPYDGNNTATINTCTVTNVVAGDTVTCTAPGGGTFSQSNVGTGLTVTVPAANIVLAGTSAGNYTIPTASPTTTANIAAAAPVFSNLTQPPPITYGTPTISLSGTICAPGPVCPPPPETVRITIANAHQDVPIGANGMFSTTTFPAGAIDASKTPYPITYSYTSDGNFNSALDNTTTTLTVNKATPVFSSLMSNNPNATYGQPITFTATLTGVSGDPQPTGNVVFTDTYTDTFNNKSNPTVICTSALTQNGTTNSTAPCTPSPTMLAGSHSIVATYTDNTDYGPAAPSTAFVQTVQRATPTTSITSSLNPSVQGQSVTFTAPVTGVSGGLPPTGSVTFTYTNNGGNGSSFISECPNPMPLVNNQATCMTKTLASGMDNVTAAYSGDNNYTVSAPSLTQIVQDFVLGGLPSLLTVAQGSDNNGGLYPQPVSVTVSPLPPYPYNGTVTLTCSVSPMLASGPTCSLGDTSIPQGTGTASVTITTVATTPIGPYNVMITGQDGGSAKSTVLPVSVANYSSTLPVASGQPGIVAVPFVGTSGVNVNFLCSQVTGPGPNGTQVTEPYVGNTYHIGCTANPATALLSTDRSNPTSVTVTITSSTLNAHLTVPGRILATLWLGMPAIVLVGSLRFGKLSRKRVLQLLGMLLVLVALLQGIGCGGGFTRPPSNTPAGFYSVLVVGQDSTGVQASAVIPFNVVGGN